MYEEQDVELIRQVGNFRLERFTVSKEAARFTSTMAALRGNRLGTISAGRYKRLMQGNRVWMSDTPMEKATNYEFVRKAKGDILIFGLGIGMILDMLKKETYGEWEGGEHIERRTWDRVTSITIVELNPEVIECVGPEYAKEPKIKIVQGDAYTWKPEPGQKFDTIYFDIWPDICGDNWKDMKKLRARTRTWKNQGAWCGMWCESDVKYQLQRAKREAARWGRVWG